IRPMLAIPRSAIRANRSPLRAMASSRVFRERTSENSTATKKPFRASRTTIETMRPSTATNLHGAMHDHHHDHAHGHDHAHADAADERSTRALRAALALTLAVLVAEVV